MIRNSFGRHSTMPSMYRRVETTPEPEIVEQPEHMRDVEGWMKRPGEVGFLVEEIIKPIGAAWVRCWTDNQRGYGFVNEATPELSLTILPDHRGRSVGTKALR